MTREEKAVEILTVSLQLQKIGIYAFVEYSPHVNGLTLRIYADEWETYTNPTYIYRMYLAADFMTEEELDAKMDEAIALLYELREMRRDVCC